MTRKFYKKLEKGESYKLLYRKLHKNFESKFVCVCSDLMPFFPLPPVVGRYSDCTVCLSWNRDPHFEDRDWGRTASEGVRIIFECYCIVQCDYSHEAHRWGRGITCEGVRIIFESKCTLQCNHSQKWSSLPHEGSSLICSPPSEDRLFLGVINHIS